MPYTIPDLIQSTVFVATACFGTFTSIAGSKDVPCVRAFNDVPSPGYMAPPLKSLFSPSTVTVVAVPMSMMIHGNGYFSAAATAVVTRSAPKVPGSSIAILIPVFIPGPTVRTSTSAISLTAFSSKPVTTGTTEEITAPSKLSASIPFNPRISLNLIAYPYSVSFLSVGIL